jgi:hypothetical protein
MCRWGFRFKAEPKRWIRVTAPAPAKPAWRFARSARSHTGVPISALVHPKTRSSLQGESGKSKSRGNRIKDAQLELFADRTSSHTFRANQLRLWLASFAYVLVEALRRLIFCQPFVLGATQKRN